MKKPLFQIPIFPLILLMCFTLSCNQQGEEVDVKADINAINDLYKKATLALSTGDSELYLSIFTEDAVIMAPDAPAINGKANLQPIIEGLIGMFDLDLPYTAEEVKVNGDKAFARSSFLYSMTPKEGGETITRSGKEIDILKRQADGSWKIYIQCWNYNEAIQVE